MLRSGEARGSRDASRPPGPLGQGYRVCARSRCANDFPTVPNCRSRSPEAQRRAGGRWARESRPRERQPHLTPHGPSEARRGRSCEVRRPLARQKARALRQVPAARGRGAWPPPEALTALVSSFHTEHLPPELAEPHNLGAALAASSARARGTAPSRAARRLPGGPELSLTRFRSNPRLRSGTRNRARAPEEE